MANSKDRRTLRRQLQEAGLGHLLQPVPTPQTKEAQKKRFSIQRTLSQIPLFVWALIGALATAITLLQGYPWLSLQKDESLDSRNPYAMMLIATNGGYFPITHIKVDCIPTLTTDIGSNIQNNHYSIPINGTYGHDGKFTLPCMRFIAMQKNAVQKITKAELKIVIEYSVMSFARSQSFHLNGLADLDGNLHWSFSE